MASKDMKYNLRIDAKDARKALQDTGDDADDTRTKAQKLSDALGKLADDADAEFADMKSASNAMATALGSDFVDAQAKAGRSTDTIVQGLREMGLSFDDIRGDADQLADAVKRLDTVRANVDSLGASAKNTSGDFDRVRSSADQSKSVLANMVGNSTQDIAGLGGVAGTAGMALGQLGEYATEGGISMSNLAKVAGPMAALTIGTLALSAAVKAVGSEAREARREEKLWHEVHEDLLDQKFADAAEKLRSEWADTLPILDKLGFAEKDLVQTLAGRGDMLATLTARHDELGTAIANQTDTSSSAALAMREEYNLLDDVLENLNEGIEAKKADIATTTQQTKSAASFEAELRNLYGTTETATRNVTTFSDAAHEASIATDKAEASTRKLDETVNKFFGALDQEDAFAKFEQSMITYYSEVEHSDQSTRDYKRSLGELIVELGNVPTETKTQMIAAIDEESFASVEARIQLLARTRTISINGQLVGADLRNLIEGRGATGAIVNRPTVALIGEAGPEAVVPLNRTAGNSPLGGFGGGESITINNTFVGYSGTVQERQRAELMARRQAMMLRAGGRPG